MHNYMSIFSVLIDFFLLFLIWLEDVFGKMKNFPFDVHKVRLENKKFLSAKMTVDWIRKLELVKFDKPAMFACHMQKKSFSW